MLAPEITLPRITPMKTALGAEICEIDLSVPVGPESFSAIEQALDEHLVLLFRDQTLTDQQLVDFSRLFGELDPPAPNPYGKTLHEAHPEINVISNVRKEGRPIGNLGAGEAVWHADMTYLDNPPKAAVLYSLEIPNDGGATYFANMFAAYEALDDDLKKKINTKIRSTLSPRHVPDEIYAISDVPRTLNAKKLEVPVKKILAGIPLDQAVNVDSMANPDSIGFFVKLAKKLN